MHKAYRFYLILHTSIQSWPKVERFALGVKVEHSTLELLELLFLARGTFGVRKKAALEKADLKLQMLKLLVRLAYDSKAVNQQKYLLLETDLQEIGRMLGGWLKSLKVSMHPKEG